MENNNTTFSVGIFVIVGLASLIYLTVVMGNFSFLNTNRYPLVARFVSASGLNVGAFVEVGGVRIGNVETIALDPESYEAIVGMTIDSSIVLQDDSIASIRTSGIIGDKFVKISPGGSEKLLGPGGEIWETESSINLEELISKYIFESGQD